MRVLVTGGSGFLGGNVVRALVARGDAVRALVRSDAGAKTVEALGATAVRGDLDDPASLAAAVTADLDALFHTAADTSQWAPHDARQTRINVDGTRTLVDAALHVPGLAFLHTSSVSAYSHLQHAVLREDVEQLGGQSSNNYERTKFLGEQVVREGLRRGLRAIIFNPSHILGPGDTHNWSRLIAMVANGTLPGAPPGYGPFADAREIAKAQVRALERGKSGESYLLGGEHASFVELLAMVGRKLGKPTPKKPIPAWALKLYGSAFDVIGRITGREPRITARGAAMTSHHLEVDSSKAVRELDYRVTPLGQLLDDTISWMRAAGMIAA
jgi:nucleoside-diphosphate-sugar epimerase